MSYRAAVSDGRLRLEVYDDIGFGGITAAGVSAAIRGHEGPIDLHICSGGGDVVDMMGIYTLLCERDVVTHIDGLAASAASVIAMAGREIHMVEHGAIMIHRAWACAEGNADELQRQAAVLSLMDQRMEAIYAARMTPGTDVAALMSAETWFTAEDAHAAGLVDHITHTTVRMAASLDGRLTDRAPAYARALLQGDNEMVGIRAALGVSADESDDHVVALVVALQAEAEQGRAAREELVALRVELERQQREELLESIPRAHHERAGQVYDLAGIVGLRALAAAFAEPVAPRQPSGPVPVVLSDSARALANQIGMSEDAAIAALRGGSDR